MKISLMLFFTFPSNGKLLVALSIVPSQEITTHYFIGCWLSETYSPKTLSGRLTKTEAQDVSDVGSTTPTTAETSESTPVV